MAQQVPVTIPSGKNNMLASLVGYMNTVLPMQIPSGLYDGNFVSYGVKLEQYEEAATFPSISVEDIGMPGLGAYAFDKYLGKYTDDSGNILPFYGYECQTLVEFNMQADINQLPTNLARQACYQMFDQLDYMLRNTGMTDHSGNELLPVISMINYDTNPAAVVPGCSIWCPTEKDSILFPTYVGTDPERPGIKRLSLRARIKWQMQETPSVTI